MDVRMLSDGRPFALQVHDPKRARVDAEDVAAMERDINARYETTGVRVRGLCLTSKACYHAVGQASSEHEKEKSYVARRASLSASDARGSRKDRLHVSSRHSTGHTDACRPSSLRHGSSAHHREHVIGRNTGFADSVLLRLRSKPARRQRVRPRRRREDDSESRHSPRLSSEHHSTRRHRDQRRLEPERRVDDGQRLVSRAASTLRASRTPAASPRPVLRFRIFRRIQSH